MQIRFDDEWDIVSYRGYWWGVSLAGEIIGPHDGWREVHRILQARE